MNKVREPSCIDGPGPNVCVCLLTLRSHFGAMIFQVTCPCCTTVIPVLGNFTVFQGTNHSPRAAGFIPTTPVGPSFGGPSGTDGGGPPARLTVPSSNIVLPRPGFKAMVPLMMPPLASGLQPRRLLPVPRPVSHTRPGRVTWPLPLQPPLEPAASSAVAAQPFPPQPLLEPAGRTAGGSAASVEHAGRVACKHQPEDDSGSDEGRSSDQGNPVKRVERKACNKSTGAPSSVAVLGPSKEESDDEGDGGGEGRSVEGGSVKCDGEIEGTIIRTLEEADEDHERYLAAEGVGDGCDGGVASEGADGGGGGGVASEGAGDGGGGDRCSGLGTPPKAPAWLSEAASSCSRDGYGKDSRTSPRKLKAVVGEKLALPVPARPVPSPPKEPPPEKLLQPVVANKARPPAAKAASAPPLVRQRRPPAEQRTLAPPPLKKPKR
jgi:hypothetical protein